MIMKSCRNLRSENEFTVDKRLLLYFILLIEMIRIKSYFMNKVVDKIRNLKFSTTRH